MERVVPDSKKAFALPKETVVACLPHWLEAAGWTAALMSDATAAAMGRLPATPRTGGHRSSLDYEVCRPYHFVRSVGVFVTMPSVCLGHGCCASLAKHWQSVQVGMKQR